MPLAWPRLCVRRSAARVARLRRWTRKLAHACMLRTRPTHSRTRVFHSCTSSSLSRPLANPLPTPSPRDEPSGRSSRAIGKMFRNTYDSDNTVFSPQGRLHQVEYALEAVKQGSAVVGLRSKTHAVLVALKRAPSELASHQKKMLRIDNHIGMGFAGLTSDARVLSNYMRQLCLSSRLLYSRPLPVSRLIASLSDRAQLNTMQYGKRPYGVGFLVIGVDSQGPHLYEFSPTGNCFEYYAMALGARSQSAKTYLEKNMDEFDDLSLDDLIVQGLYALRDSLQQGKELDLEAVSLSIVGPNADADASSPLSKGAEKFKIIEGEALKKWLDRLDKREGQVAQPLAGDAAPASGTTTAATGGVDSMEE